MSGRPENRSNHTHRRAAGPACQKRTADGRGGVRSSGNPRSLSRAAATRSRPRGANLSPACSVVVRCFNEARHIGRLLSGILSQTAGAVDIVLVDSGSTDGTVAIASRYPVRLVAISPKDFTFGRSLNLGCRAARSDLIVVASAHVYPVYPDWLERLLEPFQDRRIAMTYGKQRGDERTRFSEEQIFHKWFPETSVAWQDHPFCNNANAAIRKALWKQHPFDESLPALEDIEWATWAMARGYGLAYAGEAEVVHVHDETPRQVFGRYRREAMALRRIHPHTHFRVTDLVRLFLSNVVSDVRHARRAGRLGSVATEILWFRWMQFWGTYRGFALVGPLTQELRQAFYYPRGQSGGEPTTPRHVRPLDYGRAAVAAGPPGAEPMTAAGRTRRRSRSHHG